MTDDSVSRRSVLKGVGAGVAGLAATGVASADDEFEEYNVGVKAGAKGPGTAAAKRAADSVKTEVDLGAKGKFVTGKFSAQARKGLENNPHIDYVEPNYTAYKLAEKLPAGIDRVDADVLHSEGTTGSGATIAILDTGVDDDHPDLGANVDPSLGAAFETECGAESGGCRYGGEGYNGNDCNYVWSDDDDHGSHVAGSANAVRGNGEGVAGGVSTEATIMPVKVLTGCGSGSYSAIADGIRHAADNGADVINMSLGASSGSTALKDACQYAYDNGVVIVASAGNSGPCTDCVGFPAAYSTVIAVSAVDPDTDALADFSSTGPEVELAAPGVDTLSTIPPESDDGSTYANGYERFSGTSMSSPHVAGGAGQVVANSSLSNADVRQQLKDSAEDIGLGSNESGAGLLDAEAAVDSLGNTDTAPSASWVNPSGGDTVSGTVTVQIDASDSEDADDTLDVTYTVGSGSSRSTTYNSTSGYYEDSWDTTGVSDGDYSLEATATDSAGNTSSSTITVTVSNTESALAVSTGSASNVGTSSATLNGSLDDLGGASSADVSFEWGPSGGSLSNTTSTQTLSATGSFSADVSGLSSDTSYDFRAVASASDGDSDTGATGSFTTDQESTSSAPAIDSFSVSSRTTGPWLRTETSWAVSDADADLDTVEVALVDSSGAVVTSTTNFVSGSSASGTDKLRTRGSASAVELTVTDAAGNVTTDTRSI